MSDLCIPSREQRLLDLYSKDFILMFEYESFVRGVMFEDESFNFNLALSRMTMRFADMVRTNALFPRLKGVYSKTLVGNAWAWSKSAEALRSLAGSGSRAVVIGDAALRLTTLKDVPRKMACMEVCMRPSVKADIIADAPASDALRVRRSLFRVHTGKEDVVDGLQEYHDSSGLSFLIPSDELQFLMLCANSIFQMDGNSFNDACLQWVMDAVDIVRLRPEINWERVAHLALVYGQNATLMRAMDILKDLVPSVLGNISIPVHEPSQAEMTAMNRHMRFLELDARCRKNASKRGFLSLCCRPVFRLQSNWMDLLRYYPCRNLPGMLRLALVYHYRKYCLKLRDWIPD